MSELNEDKWIVDVARGITRGWYRNIPIEIRQNEGVFEIFLDGVPHSTVEGRSPVRATYVAKEAVDEMYRLSEELDAEQELV